MIYPFFYALIFLVSLVYTIAGFQKVRGKEPMKSRMDEMNHGGIVMKLIGIVELLGVIGLWFSATRALALVSLLPFSIGGLAAHIVLKHNFKERDIPAVLMIIVIGIALYLDPSFSILWNN
jgi:hypothetical protein